MRVLITGATGFIGRAVARSLLDAGCELHALIRSGTATRLGPLAGQLRIIEGDLLALDSVQAELRGARPELCVHLGWYAAPGKYLTAQENLPLVRASLRLAELLEEVGCARMVGAGTCLEYQLAEAPLAETSPLAPVSLYAASKLAVCSILEQRAKLLGRSFAWARLFYLYGPHEPKERLVPAVILPLLHGGQAEVTRGEQQRDFLHVADVGRAIASVALSRLEGPVNIGSGQAVSVRELVQTLGELCSAPERVAYGALPSRPGEPPMICADNAKLRSTGWTPEHDLRSGLAATVAWWKAKGA